MLNLLFSSPIAFAILAVVLVASITIHEFAHAWAADHLGDPTPRSQGRITLNPLAHLDPLGTLAILLIGFGWGRPVVFDPYNLKNPVKDVALIALAGPASNLILATIVAVAFKLGLLGFLSIFGASAIITLIVSLNVMLAIFNLIPVFPLDGEKILVALLPRTTAIEYSQFM
ncbi:MAG TPA: site-2 protease family protein, partial [Candidatus Woesebacteria bacterium]|nr:site-2 protease family protein [Candidatus Woesebacteria bacterium]